MINLTLPDGSVRQYDKGTKIEICNTIIIPVKKEKISLNLSYDFSKPFYQSTY